MSHVDELDLDDFDGPMVEISDYHDAFEVAEVLLELGLDYQGFLPAKYNADGIQGCLQEGVFRASEVEDVFYFFSIEDGELVPVAIIDFSFVSMNRNADIAKRMIMTEELRSLLWIFASEGQFADYNKVCQYSYENEGFEFEYLGGCVVPIDRTESGSVQIQFKLADDLWVDASIIRTALEEEDIDTLDELVVVCRKKTQVARPRTIMPVALAKKPRQVVADTSDGILRVVGTVGGFASVGGDKR